MYRCAEHSDGTGTRRPGHTVHVSNAVDAMWVGGTVDSFDAYTVRMAVLI